MPKKKPRRSQNVASRKIETGPNSTYAQQQSSALRMTAASSSLASAAPEKPLFSIAAAQRELSRAHQDLREARRRQEAALDWYNVISPNRSDFREAAEELDAATRALLSAYIAFRAVARSI